MQKVIMVIYQNGHCVDGGVVLRTALEEGYKIIHVDSASEVISRSGTCYGTSTGRVYFSYTLERPE